MLKSNPPPVSNSFLALLSYSALDFNYSCSLMCFLKASSALFWVYFLLSSSSAYFRSFSSRSLCLYISAFLFLSSSLIYFYLLFLSESSCSLSDTYIFSSWEYTSFLPWQHRSKTCLILQYELSSYAVKAYLCFSEFSFQLICFQRFRSTKTWCLRLKIDSSQGISYFPWVVTQLLWCKLRGKSGNEEVGHKKVNKMVHIGRKAQLKTLYLHKSMHFVSLVWPWLAQGP